MGGPIREITVVGGGTAGWLAAVMLRTQLNRRPGREPVRVTLVESPTLPTVGVGEATVPSMRELLKQLAIDEGEFIRRCNVSFKLGVRFVDWDVDPRAGHRWYDHPFDGVGVDLQGVNAGYHFRKFGAAPGCGAFGDHISPSTRLIDRYKGPKSIGQGEYDYRVGYAYHLDAGLFAGYLREIGTERGVNHLLDDVDGVERDAAGLIAALRLREGGRWPVDLVIDCSGFRALIIQQALEEPFIPYDRWLLNDRAIPVQIPHADPARLPPCTRSTALEAGWSWRVPLWSRIGTGYVYSSAFKTDEEAIDEYLAHLGPAGAGAEPRVIRMRVGRSRRSWVGNCVAVGLSSGFIEPLESTAIYIIEMSVRLLLSNLPDRDFDAAPRDRFNARMEAFYEEVRDFVALHYIAAKRRDTPYWRAAGNDLAVPDGLADRLERWKTALPAPDDFERTSLFGFWSYLIVLFGKGWYEGRRLALDDGATEEGWRDFCRWMEGEKAKLVEALPDHYDLVRRLRGEDEEPEPLPIPAILPAGAPLSSVPLPGQAMRASVSWAAQVDRAGSLL